MTAGRSAPKLTVVELGAFFGHSQFDMGNSSRYGLIIVGAGTAGLTAALFGAHYGLKTLVVERLTPGGQIINAERIENFPGFPQGISGAEFWPMLQQQVTDAGAEFQMAETMSLRHENPYWAVGTTDGEFLARAVIVAVGSTRRKLGIPGEEELFGRGVSNCATCNGPFFKDQVVAVVGGGDSALDEAEVLAKFASQVVLFHRGSALRAHKVLQDRVLAMDKVRVRWNTVVDTVLGEDQVTGVRTRDVVTGETSQAEVSGAFIYVGLEPNTRFLQDVVPLDNAGHIPTDLWMATQLPGVFAVGDVRQHSASQLVASAGDGATAAIAAFRYIQGRE